MFEALQVPAKINFDSTFKCNASCAFCDIPDRHSEHKEPIDYEKAKAVIDRAADEGVMKVNFFGGEPLLLKKLPKLVKVAHERGMRTSLITNGTLITEKFCEEIAPHIDVVGVSVHGSELAHNRILGIANAYQKVNQGMSFLEKYGIRYGINYTIMESNYEEFEATVSYFVTTRQAKFVALNRYIENSKAAISRAPSVETLNKTLDIVRKLHSKNPDVAFSYAIYFPLCLVSNPENIKYVNSCGVGTSFCSVDFRGDIHFCSYSNKVLGNIFDAGLGSTWQSSAELQQYRDGTWLPSKCKSCELLSRCASGCKASNPAEVYSSDILNHQ
jgi:radical SAM protein with 4Fe4S-binding SPASM domain